MIRAHLPSSSLVVSASFSAAAVRALMAPGFLWSNFPCAIPSQIGGRHLCFAAIPRSRHATVSFLALRVLSKLLQFIHLPFLLVQRHTFSGLTGLESIQLICVYAMAKTNLLTIYFMPIRSLGARFDGSQKTGELAGPVLICGS